MHVVKKTRQETRCNIFHAGIHLHPHRYWMYERIFAITSRSFPPVIASDATIKALHMSVHMSVQYFHFAHVQFHHRHHSVVVYFSPISQFSRSTFEFRSKFAVTCTRRIEPDQQQQKKPLHAHWMLKHSGGAETKWEYNRKTIFREGLPSEISWAANEN